MAEVKKVAWQGAVFFGILVLATALYVVTIHLVFLSTPLEAKMGIAQKIFYFHVPSAYGMYLGAIACFAGSCGYLLRPTDGRDALARAGAETAVAFGLIVLVTGPLWGRKAWGTYWAWGDPRLTTALLSILIYIAYVVLRAFTGDGPGERKFAAALGILGAANLPIIHFSVEKWSGQHPRVVTDKSGLPTNVGLAPPMVTCLLVSFAAFTLFAVALIWARYRVELAKSRLARAEEDAIDLGLDERAEA
jgi:heme exporter protein C